MAAAGSRIPAYRRAPDEKRDRIAEAAARLFAERGYGATKTSEIAAAAGVSEGILFHHFGSKRELFAQVAGDYGRGLASAMFGEGIGTPPEVAIRRAFDYVRSNGKLHALLMVRDAELMQLAHEGTRSAIASALEDALDVATEQGVVRPMNTHVVADLLYQLVGAALEACFVRGEDQEEYLREVVLCVQGALALPAPPHPIQSNQENES